MWGERIRTKLVASGTVIALGLFVVQSVVYASSTRAPSPSETALAPSTTLVSSSAGTTVIAAATTSTTSTTVTAAPTTTSFAPKRIESNVQTAPTTAVGTAVEGAVLARTGWNAIPLLAGGVVLILLGAAIALGARRDSNSKRRIVGLQRHPSRKRAPAIVARSTVGR